MNVWNGMSFLLILYEISRDCFFFVVVFFSFAWTQNLADLKETNIFLRLQLAKKDRKRKEHTQMKQMNQPSFLKISIIFKEKFN